MSHVQFEMFCSEVLPYPYSEFGICAIYYGDNVQWTTIIEVIPENWSTTSRTLPLSFLPHHKIVDQFRA